MVATDVAESQTSNHAEHNYATEPQKSSTSPELSPHPVHNGKIKKPKENKNKKKKKNKEKESKEEEEEEETEEKEELPPVAFTQLFRYATSFELLIIFCGILAAFFAGLCMPAMVILFGRLTNSFVYQDFNYTEIIEMYPQYENWTVENITDYFGIGDFHHEIIIFGVGTSVIGVIQLLMGYIFVTSLNYTAEGQVYRLRNTFLRSILRQEIGWFDTNQTNNFASRVAEDLNKIQEGMGEKIGMFVFFMTTFFFSLINAFVHGWQLTLVVLSVFPFLGVSMGMIAKVQTSLAANELKEYAKAGSIAEEILSSVRTVLSFGGEEKEVKRYEKNLESAKVAGLKRGIMTGFGMGMMWFIIYASYSLTFWYGTKLILDSRPPNPTKNYDPSDLIVVFFSVLMGAMNVGQSSPYVEAFNVARGAAASIFSIVDRQSLLDPMSSSGEKPKSVSGTIELKGVQFCYPSREEVEVLKGVDIRVNPGETVALVGSSGCGKSTCIQLIQRFYEPLKGEVKLDERDIRDLNLGWLRDQIGVVGQEPVLFGTTIKENIRFGKQSASFQEIKEAAKEANAHDFIMKLPKNYETQVGERGVQISGGQKQRIAIARALVKRPKILLLDEATSALDNESEAIVQKALDKASKGRTTVIVAHRLSTIRSANKIIAMQDGRIVEEGTHDDLMRMNGFYSSLVKAQLSRDEKIKYQEEKKENFSQQLESESGEQLENIIQEITFRSSIPLNRTSSIRQSLKRQKSTTSASSSIKYLKMQDKEADEADFEIVPFTEILKLNATEWHYIAGGVIFSAIQGCLMPAYAVLFGNVLGTLAVADAETARNRANLYSLLFFVVGIVAAVTMFFQAYMFTLSGEILTMRLRKRGFQTMLQQEMGWYDHEKNTVGALCSRLSGDASAVQGATGSRVGTVVQSVATLVFSLVLAMVYSPKLGAVMLPFVPFLLVSIYLQSKILMGQSLTESKVLEDAGKIAIESISNIRTVASLHKEEHIVDLYAKALYGSHIEAQNKSHIRGFAFGFAQSIIFFAYAAVMFYGGHLVETEQLEFEEVFKVAEAMILGTMMVGQAMAFAPNYNKAKVAASRMIALFKRTPDINTSNDVGLKMTGELNAITLKDVYFSYPTRPESSILNGMTVEIQKGKSVALVGSSGCGKSTIINLLERFYNFRGGSVILNDTSIEALNVGYVRSLFGLVSQEPVLFDRTIAENIAYGDNTRTFSQSDIEEVAKQANIHDFVKGLPEDYNTRVGAKGTQLSGGQKQRIAIARALIRKPQVLLLDEATSALDAESEQTVQETLEEVQRQHTSIVIAHRLSTIRNVDKIIVIDAGVVKEEGKHDELMEKKGHYWKLYNSSA